MSGGTTQLKVALAGFGTVGAGVYELLEKNAARFEANYGIRLEVVKILVSDMSKKRDGPWVKDPSPLFTDDVGSFITTCTGPGVNMVIELIGGTTKAKDIVFQSLQSQKQVVTANKALLATCMAEVEAVLEKPEQRGNLAFEAAVCGGIPIIGTVISDFVSDEILSVSGILNGTTNYILSKMETEGVDYAPTLKEAQDLGYAEADPAADVDGYDAQSKLAILAKLAFGKTVPVSEIPCKGISAISKIDFEYAKKLGCTIKLLGQTTCTPVSEGSDEKVISCFVSPFMVPQDHAIAAARGPTNLCAVKSRNMGQTVFVGPGAGRFPTANSVVNDVVKLCKMCKVGGGIYENPLAIGSDPAVKAKIQKIDPNYTCKSFYIRIHLRDGLGITKEMGQAAEQQGVSINSILQNPIADKENVYTVVTTDECKLSQIEKFSEQVGKFAWCRGPPVFYPFLY